MTERDQLILSHIAFVKYLAKPFFGRGIPAEDIISAGYCGLVKAVDRFDASKGFKLTTFAAFYIREAMDTFVKESGMIKQPGYIGRRRKKLFKAFNRFVAENERNPTDEELASITGMNIDKIVELRQLQTMNDNHTDEELLHSLADEPDEPPVAIDIAIFECLDERELLIVQLRHGYIEDKVFTLSEVSQRLDISRERVRQIEARALDKLREKKLRRPDA